MNRNVLFGISAVKNRMRIFSLVLLLLLSLTLQGCGGDSNSVTNPGNSTVGPDGGTVTDSGGASVTIPAEALSSDVIITVNTILAKDDLPLDNQTFLPLMGGAEFKPSGTQFAIPVTIKIPVDPPLGTGEEATVFYWDESENRWCEVEGDVTVALGGESLTVEVTHFSLFSVVTNVFDNFHDNFGDGSTAESAFASYISWFKSNVTNMNRKGVYEGDCYKVVGLRLGLAYDVMHYPDGPHYQGIPYVMEGETSNHDVIFYKAFELVQSGVIDKNYNLEIHAYLECCAPEVTVSADPAMIGTNEASEVTATVTCDDEAMKGSQVSFESLGGLGTVSPPTGAVDENGKALTTFTAGDDEGTESIRASLTTCNDQENPDGAAQIEISDSWTADMNIAFVLDEGDEPMYVFTDNVSISLNLSIDEGVVTGTGTGSHNVDLSIATRCGEQNMIAPEFSVVVTGAKVGNNLEFMVISMSMPISFTLHCVWESSEEDFDYPIFGLLESSMMAQYIVVTVPWENGGTDSGSGSDPNGGTNPMTWSYTIMLNEGS
ncbi:hypothetical protein J7M07_06635 [bacterium]|nr:hypothetical protein [bacterium]